MCPACITTAALAVVGATSAGGLTALVVTVIHSKNGGPAVHPTIDRKGKQRGEVKRGSLLLDTWPVDPAPLS